MKWKCKSCDDSKEICDEGHDLTQRGKRVECEDCNMFFNPPQCCGQEMYVAS